MKRVPNEVNASESEPFVTEKNHPDYYYHPINIKSIHNLSHKNFLELTKDLLSGINSKEDLIKKIKDIPNPVKIALFIYIIMSPMLYDNEFLVDEKDDKITFSKLLIQNIDNVDEKFNVKYNCQIDQGSEFKSFSAMEFIIKYKRLDLFEIFMTKTDIEKNYNDIVRFISYSFDVNDMKVMHQYGQIVSDEVERRLNVTSQRRVDVPKDWGKPPLSPIFSSKVPSSFFSKVPDSSVVEGALSQGGQGKDPDIPSAVAQLSSKTSGSSKEGILNVKNLRELQKSFNR